MSGNKIFDPSYILHRDPKSYEANVARNFIQLSDMLS